MALIILIQCPDGKVIDIPMFGGTIVIGRSSKADVKIEDGLMSSRHCSVELRGEMIVFQDLGSSNGSFLNNSKINSMQIRLGDVIQIGNSFVSLDSKQMTPKEREQHSYVDATLQTQFIDPNTNDFTQVLKSTPDSSKEKNRDKKIGKIGNFGKLKTSKDDKLVPQKFDPSDNEGEGEDELDGKFTKILNMSDDPSSGFSNLPKGINGKIGQKKSKIGVGAKLARKVTDKHTEVSSTPVTSRERSIELDKVTGRTKFIKVDKVKKREYAQVVKAKKGIPSKPKESFDLIKFLVNLFKKFQKKD